MWWHVEHGQCGYCEAQKFPPGHYHSPLPDVSDVVSRAVVLFRQDVDLRPSIDLARDAQLILLNELSRYYEGFDWPEHPDGAHRFHLSQAYFCHGDAIILYAMLRHLKPRRVIEVGSGWSSALMLDTDERFLSKSIHFRFVEPFPERFSSVLLDGDRDRCTVMQERVEDVPVPVFRELEANDVLFIDSSHVSKIGSDVNFLIFEVLPSLNPGVFVHFHDIFWPFEYPKGWILEGRAWNEAYLLRAFLQYNDTFEIVLFNSFVAHAFREFMEVRMPKFLVNPGGSLWLRKTCA